MTYLTIITSKKVPKWAQYTLLIFQIILPIGVANAQQIDDSASKFIAVDKASSIVPEQISFFVRPSLSQNMIGGVFEGSNQALDAGFEAIYSISEAPAGGDIDIALDITGTGYRYFRYVAPDTNSLSIVTFDVTGPVFEVADSSTETDEVEQAGLPYSLNHALTYNASNPSQFTELIVSDPTYISIRPSTNILTVQFYHIENGNEKLVHTERAEPYDYFGSNSQVKPNDIPGAGLDLIAVVTAKDGRTQRLEAKLLPSDYVAPEAEPPSDPTGGESETSMYSLYHGAKYNSRDVSTFTELVVDDTTYISVRPNKGISTVQFYHLQNGIEVPVHTERAAPFDYLGTNRKVEPMDIPATGLDLIAVLELKNGDEERLVAQLLPSFSSAPEVETSEPVVNPEVPATIHTLQYGSTYNSNDLKPLEELVIGGPTYITIRPSTDISTVQFYHSENGVETLVHTERAEPYDYFGTNKVVLPGDIPDDGLSLVAIVTSTKGNVERLEAQILSAAKVKPENSLPDGFASTVVDGRTIFGLNPAWAKGREFDKALDNNIWTYYDYGNGGTSEGYVGFDNEFAEVPTQITYTVRDRWAARMVGGRFQGSNTSPYEGYETIYEITEVPKSNTQTISIETAEAYRYFRYLSPVKSYGNIAEFSIEFAGLETSPDPVSEAPVIPEPAPEIVDEIVYKLKYAYAYNSPIKYDLDQLLLDSPAYISIYPETDISRVLFYHLDNNGAETLVHTELVAPYDYFGANSKVTPDQIPEEGRTIIAVITLEDGQSKTLQATLTKAGEITVDPEPVIVVESPEQEIVPEPEPISDELLPINIDATNPDSVVIEFSTGTEGQVSAAVYDKAGRLVRTLLRGKVLQAGNHSIRWDGLDRDGVAVEPGDYTFKVLRSDGLKSEFVTNLGINPDSSSYDTWVGNHEGGASSVAVDDTGVYIAAEITETAPVLIKQSLDGKTRYWSKERIDVTNGRFQGGASLAADGSGRVYMLQQNGYLQVIDAATGDLIASWDILPSSVNRGNELFLYMHEIDSLAGADMAAKGDTIVVSFKSSNLVAWINPSNGSFETQFAVDAPRGVAVTTDEEALVLSGEALYGLRPGQSRTLISSGLSDAQRITYDASSDTVLITFGIKGAQVKRFSMSGTLIATYGKEGGRESGPYIAEDFYSVRDITADGNGGFFVSEPEAQPRRLARFNAAGLLIDEWYGGQNYYAWAEPDPRIPGSAWMFTNEGFVHANINLDTGVWEVVGAWMLENLADGLIEPIAGHQGRWRVLYHGDDCYLVSELIPQVLSYKNGALKAVSISSNDAGQLEKAITMTGETSSPDSFRWLDQNGDGRPQKSEFTFSKYGEVPTGTHIQSDFSYLGFDRQDNAIGLLQSKVQWSDLGPYFPIGRETDFDQEIASTPTQERASSRGINVFASKDGDFYTHYNLSVENHGVYWPTHWASISRFVKWDKDGNEMWSVGRHAYHGGLAGTHSTTYVKTPPGQFHVLARVIGEVGNHVVLADRVESMGMVWSKDGLLVGSLFDRRADDGLPEEVYSWYLTSDSRQAITTTDNASGGSIIEYEDGTVLWFTQGRNSVPVYKVSGWDDMDRDEASFKLSEKASVPQAKGTGLVARYFKGSIDSTPDVKIDESQVWHGIDGLDDVIDGADGPVYDWSNGPTGLGQSTNFTARWKGEVEVPLTEEFIFSLYARGGVRLWLDGQQIIYSWNEITDKVESPSIQLEAGKRYAIQLDFITTQNDPALSLNWESLSMDRHRIPSEYLYPVDSAADLKQVRDAADYINAADYDVESGDMEDWLVDEYAVEGVGQRGLGKSGAYIGYTTVDFGGGLNTLRLQGSARPSRSTDTYPINLAFRLGSPSGPNIAEVDMTGVLRTFSVALENSVSGVQDVYVINTTSDDKHSIDFRWFKFE